MRSGQLGERFGKPIAVDPVQISEPSEEGEREDASRVPVCPAELERVVADLTDVAQLRVARVVEANGARMPLAAGAGAIAPQDPVREPRGRAVGPAEFHDAGPMRGLDPGEGGRPPRWQ